MDIARIAGIRVGVDGPWGRLTGVRPSKIVHRCLDRGDTPEEIRRFLQSRYGASEERAALLTEISVRNRPQVPVPENYELHRAEVDLYIGIPYCSSRCVYCSFPSSILPTDTKQVFSLLTAIGQDIDAVVKLTGECGLTPRTLYIGGGTPTCLPFDAFRELMYMVQQAFPHPGLEFTVEAGRPDSIDPQKVKLMRQAGVTRVSVNPQSMRRETLDRIGRKHSPEQVTDAFYMLRDAGFQAINMDLIAGLPGEDAATVCRSVEQVLAMRPDNVTVHTLALKRGAEMREYPDVWELPTDQEMADMVADSRRLIRLAGYFPYYLYRQKNSPGRLENVGYSIPGAECIYNIDIIEERRTIIGMGPSAATKATVLTDWRLESLHFPKDIPTYLKTVGWLAEKRNQLLHRWHSGQLERDLLWKEPVS